MCPPYLLVSYPELYDLLEGSPLIHDRTILFVEYPKQLSKEVSQERVNESYLVVSYLAQNDSDLSWTPA
jgi:hypothetical protein